MDARECPKIQGWDPERLMTFNSVFPFAYFATPQGHGFWQQLQKSFLEEDLAPAAKPAKEKKA